jgi:branched-chain amino acid transport system substrate-binding protein
VTGQVIKAGLDAVKGDLSNKAAFKQALLDKPINTAFGPMAFDPRNNQSILDIYVNRVEKDAQGRPFNTVVHTYQRIQDPGPRS